MTEPVDLEALYHVTDVADFLGEQIKMSPAQFRTILHEMTASRAVEAAVARQVENLRELVAKLQAEIDVDHAERMRIVNEFGDYDALAQSREICEDRIQKLQDVRTLHRELSSEKWVHDFQYNAAFHAVIEMLGEILDGTFVPEPEKEVE